MSRKLIVLLIALGSTAVATAAGPVRTRATTRIETTEGPVDVDASSATIDYRTQHAVLDNVTITQNDIRVTANRAVGNGTGISFENNRWVFTGNVHIRSELRGNLTSESATVEFRNGQIQSALAVGQPAEFEQTRSNTGVLARGHADSIEYDVAANTVRLTDDAWLKYGDSVETAPVLVYDIKAQKLLGAGTPKPGGRVHMTILPNKGAKSAGSAAAKRPGAGPAKAAAKPAKPPQAGSGTGQ